MINLLANLPERVWASLKHLFSWVGLGICLVAVLCVTANDLTSIKDQNQLYLLYLCGGLFLGYRLEHRGLFVFLLLLPLTPRLHSQLFALFQVRELGLSNLGLDFAAGFVLGRIFAELLQFPLNRSSSLGLSRFPWQIGLLLSYLLTSTCLAIIRNLRQSASGTSLEGIVFNLAHFRPYAWQDDFMPVNDLLAYGVAGAVFACILPFLIGRQDRNQLIFRPLICGVFLAAIMGYFQARTGFGLPEAYLGFRRDALGFVAIGFQPDIHAFAGHMLLGAVGLWAYLFEIKSTQEKIWTTTVIGLAWIALLLSKSRASLVLAMFGCFCILATYVWLERRMYFNKLVFAVSLVFIAALAGSLYVSWHPQTFGSNNWLLNLINRYAQSGYKGLSAGTQNFGGRPEIYSAGIRMFSEFPILGLGQGGFFRQSADISFSKSFMLLDLGGENAHNYFLQVLVENGLVGIALFLLAALSPLFLAKSKKMVFTAALGLGALFLGNIFAHSFLVRENLILASTLLALMYAWAIAVPISCEVAEIPKPLLPAKRIMLVGAAILVILVAGSIEAYRSFYRPPYQTGQRCFVSKPLASDGWSTGILEIPLPAKTQGLRVHIASVGRPDLSHRPLQARMDIAYYENFSHDHPSLGTVFHEWKSPGPGVMEIRLADNSKLNNGKGKAVLRLSNCFNPRDYGVTRDGRNLGVLVDRIEIF